MNNFEILDLGLVYYKNAIIDPEKIIKEVEDLDKKILINKNKIIKTTAKPWSPWNYEEKFFCWQKFFIPQEQINKDDFFYDEIYSISKKLFSPLDEYLSNYKTLYPFLNVKSRDDSMHLLKYEKSGYLPAHQDHGVSTRTLSVLMYLNDDYEGGNLVFKNSNLSFKPEAGSILFFPSNFLYVHEVEEITDGIKYCLPNWYHNVPKEKRYFSTGEE